ncbi:hypothetical protein M514_08312, partial [Trichuris suis]
MVHATQMLSISFVVPQAACELPQPLLSILLTSIQQMQSRLDGRFDMLERRLLNIERVLSSIQKQQVIVAKKRKRCSSPVSFVEPKQFIASPGSFNGNVSNSLSCLGQSVHGGMPSTASQSEGMVVSSCSSKTLSEFMKSAQMNSIPPLQGQCVVSDGGFVLSNVIDDQGGCYSFKFPSSLVEKMLKDNPPEPTGWSASKALVTLLDYIYHPLELAMRRLPALPASSSLSSNLQGRQKSELFVGTQYEDGIEFSPDRLLPCCKLIEHYYQGWRYKAFERNHAFREIVHKKCRTRRRDLKQYLQQCGKTKEQVLDLIIKGVDLPPRDFLIK